MVVRCSEAAAVCSWWCVLGVGREAEGCELNWELGRRWMERKGGEERVYAGNAGDQST